MAAKDRTEERHEERVAKNEFRRFQSKSTEKGGDEKSSALFREIRRQLAAMKIF